MIGTFGGVVFTVSTQQVRTFTGFTRSGTPRITEHEIIGQKSRIEYQAAGLEQIGFQMRFGSMQGVNPTSELQKLRRMRDNGAIAPLIIGGRYEGEWCITSLSESHTKHDGRGRVLVATADVQLKEVRTEVFDFGAAIVGAALSLAWGAK